MNILIIDDERSIRLSLSIALRSIATQVFEAESGEEGLDIYRKNNIDLVITDIKLPGIDGVEVLSRLKAMDDDCTVIMITFLSDVKLAVDAMKKGAYDYFTKPFSVEDIKESIIHVQEYILQKEKIEKNDDFFNMIGESDEMLQIKQLIKRLSTFDYDTCVLVQGESGCGKEVVAKAIHQSKGLELPFVDINCAAIPKGLQESELFGYEKGAFTEASKSKVGLIEKANGGILFLDEIGDMDLELQAKLLRVLQEKKFRRLGSNDEKVFQGTVIAATNKDIEKDIEEGKFRLDLYYRLNIIPIVMPPLRKRKGDIRLLIDHYVRFYNEQLQRQVVIHEEVYECLTQYKWLGNVRELKNLIERIMILSPKSLITIDQLPLEMVQTAEDSIKLFSLEASEKSVILKALVDNQWNITQSSKALGISRLTLRRKIDKYELKE